METQNGGDVYTDYVPQLGLRPDGLESASPGRIFAYALRHGGKGVGLARY
jgi:hypothetical protein